MINLFVTSAQHIASIALILLLATLPAAAQDPAPAESTPAPGLFNTVAINQWSSITRHAGSYPDLQLIWQKVEAATDVFGIWPHPLLPARAWVATGAGLLVTEDAGRTFKPLPEGSAEKIGAVTDIAFPLDSTDVCFVATKRKGIWTSGDNGKTFKQIGSKATGLAGDSVQFLDIYSGDLTGRTILACHGDSAPGLSRSTDGGQTWSVLHKEYHVFRAYTARAASEGIYVAASKAADPDVQGLYRMPSFTEPWQEMVRDVVCTGFTSPIMGDSSVLASTAERGLLRIARGGGVVKRIGPADIDSWAGIGATWGPTADSQIVFAFDPKTMGMAAWTMSSEGEGQELLDKVPFSDPPIAHSKGLYTNAIVREGAQLRASADGAVFYASINSMLYRAARGGNGVRIVEASIKPAVNRFDPMSQQNSLDQVRDALAQFPKRPNLAGAGASMLEVLKTHDQAMAGQRIIISAKVRSDGPKPPSVTVDLSRLGLSPTSALLDDGQHDDGAAGDGVYSNAFALNLLTYRRPDKDWRHSWPGVVGLTITAAADNGNLAGVVVPYSIVNPAGGVPFWEREQWHDIAIEQGKIKRGTATSPQGKKRGLLLGIELPGPWRARVGGSRKTLDITGAAALVLQIRTAEDSTDDISIQLRDEPVFAQPATTPAVPLLAEGFVPAKKFTTTYQRIVIPLARLLKDADEFQPGITHSIILSGKAGKPMQVMIDEVIFSYSEASEKGKVTP